MQAVGSSRQPLPVCPAAVSCRPHVYDCSRRSTPSPRHRTTLPFVAAAMACLVSASDAALSQRSQKMLAGSQRLAEALQPTIASERPSLTKRFSTDRLTRVRRRTSTRNRRTTHHRLTVSSDTTDEEVRVKKSSSTRGSASLTRFEHSRFSRRSLWSTIWVRSSRGC
jgi:hypothetical protein